MGSRLCVRVTFGVVRFEPPTWRVLVERMLAKNRTAMSNWQQSCMREKGNAWTVGLKLCDSPAEAAIAKLTAGTDQDGKHPRGTKREWLRRMTNLLKTANESARRSARRS
jgi:hypothetical protein